VESEVKLFHELLDSAQLKEIYLTADVELRKATAEPDLMNYMSTVRKKLGKLRTSERTSWQVHYSAVHRIVNIEFISEFEAAKAAEYFE
jgi:hypothetical protein